MKQHSKWVDESNKTFRQTPRWKASPRHIIIIISNNKRNGIVCQAPAALIFGLNSGRTQVATASQWRASGRLSSWRWRCRPRSRGVTWWSMRGRRASCRVWVGVHLTAWEGRGITCIFSKHPALNSKWELFSRTEQSIQETCYWFLGKICCYFSLLQTASKALERHYCNNCTMIPLFQQPWQCRFSNHHR